MTDSGSFTSLLALVDSHLSKTRISEDQENASTVSNRTPIPSLMKPGTLSGYRLTLPPGQRLAIPTIKLSDSSIQDVLAEQVANMLKAKEFRKRQEDENLRLAEEIKKINLEKNEDCGIDLQKALQTPWVPQPLIEEKVLGRTSSFELLFEPKCFDCYNDNSNKVKQPEIILPIKTDMFYIINLKVRKAKGSAFGKVLSSRLRPVAYPYLREKIKTKVVPFDFSTPSPCDVIREKLRKPTTSRPYTPDIFSII